ncbi:MAG: type 2 lantipeptide synthetase LanM family protein, partial [Acidobacteriaceae bacterium]|nr:type 2 lantipeptide synthetase LanM family protein [Acidobacteriaceae bacterium]
MEHLAFDFPSWYDALTLTERAAVLHNNQGTRGGINKNREVSKHRLEWWRSQVPFASDSYFAQCLASYGLTEEEFLYLICEPGQAIQRRIKNSPCWLASLTRAYYTYASNDKIVMPEALRWREAVGFLDVIAPLIMSALECIEQGVAAVAEEHPGAPFDRGTVKEILLASLPEQLLAMLTPTMVLELHVARLQEFLEGNTAEERFHSFLKRLRQAEIAFALLQEYPVLARQLVVRIDHWVNFSLEFLHHLAADWDAIRATFASEDDPGVLTELTGGIGDSHRGGHSVRIATFSSGLKLVYKPRAVSIEAHCQELLEWLNDRGARPAFRTLKILDYGRYGWTEFIAAASCTSTEEVRRFYQRQGAYLALLYALEATDFHFENIIAAGEHPMLLDLEALFHPRVGPHTAKADQEHAEQLVVNKISFSVLKVGLLPQASWAFGDSEGVDLSGLASLPGQLTPQPVPRWEGVGTDQMRITRQRIEISAGSNRPMLNGAEVNVLDYTEAVVDGFMTCYRLLLLNRDDLLSNEGPLARFAGDEVRVILRPTYTYGLLLRESFHPDVLRNALDRDRLFDRLWVAVENSPHLARVIPSEREDLAKGDIPIFTTRPNSRGLWNSSHEWIGDFFEEPAFALVQHRLLNLSEENCSEQLWFIRASLAALAAGQSEAQLPAYSIAELKPGNESSSLFAAACKVGDRLESMALQSGSEVSWIGIVPMGRRNWTFTPLAIDLYDGLPGVVLFLAYLGSVASSERYTALAQSALIALRHQVERARSAAVPVGGFEGWGGIIYALTHLGMIWGEPALLAEAESVVELLPALIDRDEQFDIIGGSAGCIGSLATLYRCAPSDRILAAAIQCGDHLVACAQPMERGAGWSPGAKQPKPLAGFSHGAAGIAWALLELAALTGEDRFRATALQAIEYERSLFSPEVGNWPDLREGTAFDRVAGAGNGRFAMAWCHGAPGIGLSRLHCLRHLDDQSIRAEIDAALKITVIQGFGRNHCLCHG